MTGEPTIDYEALALEAMRGVVRTVLSRIVKSGLPGDHHFYISYSTEAPGIVLSKRLREKYPREMTIVLQHRFWDLSVTEDRFEVKLTFDGIPERLVVPFSAIKVFFDPSVRYGLQFEEQELGPETGEHATPMAGNTAGARSIGARVAPPRKPRPAKKQRTDRDVIEAVTGSTPLPSSVPPIPVAKPASAAPAGASAKEASASAQAKSEDAAPANSGAQILSLDQFRKK